MIQGIMSFSTAEDYSALSDAEILMRAKREPELFAILVRRYEAPLLRRARRILFSPEDAQDAVQDAFTKMYLYADKYRPQEGVQFTSWAYTILNRVAYTKYRAIRGEQEKRADLLPEQYESLPDESGGFMKDLSVRNEVIAVLAKLPETAANVLKLQFLEGKSQEEIARKEGLSVPAVKTRVHRAKKLFQKIFTEQNHEH